MRHPQRDERFWRQVCAEYRRGGQTRPGLAAKYGVNEGTLSYHLKKSAAQARMEFLPVQVAAGPARAAAVEVVLSSGALVRAEVGADVEYVARLVRALQG